MRIGIECVHQKDERQTHDKHDVHDGSNMHRGLRLNSGIFAFPQIRGSSLLVFRKKIEDNKTPRSQRCKTYGIQYGCEDFFPGKPVKSYCLRLVF